MQIRRRVSLAIRWGLAAVGIGCAFAWGATVSGLTESLIVIPGSSEPAS
jgi:hypothetical protein